jgi:competence protein ComGF
LENRFEEALRHIKILESSLSNTDGPDSLVLLQTQLHHARMLLKMNKESAATQTERLLKRILISCKRLRVHLRSAKVIELIDSILEQLPRDAQNRIRQASHDLDETLNEHFKSPKTSLKAI